MTAQDAVVVESTGGASTRSRQALVVALVVAALALAIDQGSKVLAAAQRWADDDLRSLNAQIEYVLRDALRKAGRLKSPANEEGEDDGQ